MIFAVLTTSASRRNGEMRGWPAPSFGYNYFGTKTNKADGFGTWSSIG